MVNEEEWRERIRRETDTGYSYCLARRMEQYRTNPVLGYRTAGSGAEFETGEMLVREMKSLGLADVHKDRITVDSWEFEKAVMQFTDREGRDYEFQLGAYQTDFHTGGFREFSLVYLGKGTAADYRNVDAAGKLVLIDINQRDEWWINYPVYQARLKGAAALIAVQEQGYGEIHDTALNAQDIAGPADAPAFSMSRADAAVLKAAMGRENQVQVRLDASSTVLRDQETYNIIGTIPGPEEGMILLTAHYDSYFSGFQDDNAAVAMMLGIARAVLQSGYKPRKTLIFCAMAAEEWGVVNSKYDWSTGAYEQVFTARPDWAGKVIADLNFELPAHAHGRKDAVRCVYEYADFLEDFLKRMGINGSTKAQDGTAGSLTCQPYPGGVEVLSPIQTWSDDFSMAIGGIPSMVNDFSSGEFMETHYHSQYDNENFYQEPVYRFHHEMYAGLVLAFDRTAAVPMNFSGLFEGAGRSVDSNACPGSEADRTGLFSALEQASAAGNALYGRIREINRAYGCLLDRGEEAAALKLAAGCAPLNRALLRIFKKEQDYFVRLSWHDDVLFPQQAVQENVRAMDRAIACLENHDLSGALEAVYTIDNNRYAFLFDEEVYTYFTEYVLNQPPGRLKWGTGRIVHHQNLFGLVESLKAKALHGKTDTQEEYAALVRARQDQLGCYEDDIRYMTASAYKLLEAIGQAAQLADAGLITAGRGAGA